MSNTKANSPKIIISGGGTGGHIFPAVAIANAIRELRPEAEILFVGAEGKMEMEKVPQAGYKIIGLPVAGIQRSLSLKNLSFPFKLIKSLWKARSVISDFKPDAAVGVGGYASGPVLFAASMKNIPVFIQEQNSYAGLTNKILSKKAEKIFVAYHDMDRFFPKERIIYTGNPVRKDIADLSAKTEAYSFWNFSSSKPTLLIMGGSLGARTLNNSVLKNLDQLIESGVQVIWQTGKLYYANCDTQLKAKGTTNIRCVEFIREMNKAYAVADVVVSRAGALSISELCVVAKPTVLVPSPNVSEDHQTKNALALVSKNAALMVKDIDAENNLIGKALDLIKDQSQQKMLSENIHTFARINAAKEIAEMVLTSIKK